MKPTSGHKKHTVTNRLTEKRVREIAREVTLEEIEKMRDEHRALMPPIFNDVPTAPEKNQSPVV